MCYIGKKKYFTELPKKSRFQTLIFLPKAKIKPKKVMQVSGQSTDFSIISNCL
jgi:hypothetical protein